MLTPTPTPIEIFSVHSANIDGVFTIWLNLYPFTADAGFSVPAARAVLENVAVGEQHIALPHVKLETFVALPQSLTSGINTTMQCFSYPKQVQGGNALAFGSEPLPFEYVLSVRKLSLYGRTGKQYFRQVLQTKDVDFGNDGGVYLKPDPLTNYLGVAYLDAYLRDTPWTPVIATRNEITNQIEATREVIGYRASSVVKLRSIKAAQGRKTVLALPFKYLAFAQVTNLNSLDVQFDFIANKWLADVPRDAVLGLVMLIYMCQADNIATLKYWTDGIKPAPAPFWRPTAGLDPYSMDAHAACMNLHSCAEMLINSLGEVLENNGDTIPAIELQALQFRVWQMVTSWVWMLHKERWTGTPIPHPNATPSG